MNEDELTRRLSNAASVAPEATSPFEMTMAASTAGRPRALFAAPAVAGLLVAGGVGFLAGNNTAGFSTADGPSTVTAETTAGATDSQATDAGATGTAGGDAPVGGAPTDGTPTDEATLSGPDGFEQDFVPVLERTVGDLRVRLSETEVNPNSMPVGGVDGEVDGGPVGGGPVGDDSVGGAPIEEPYEGDPAMPDGVYFEPELFPDPDGCWDVRSTRVTIDGPNVVDATSASRPVGLSNEPTFTLFSMGLEDKSPVFVIDVFAPGAVSVSASSPIGTADDSTDLTDGRGVLVIPVPPDTSWDVMYESASNFGTPNVEVTVTMADGSTVTARDANEVMNEMCSAMLMPARGEQPADPDATLAEVTTSFDRLMDPNVPQDEKASLLDDWTGVAEASAAAQSGDFASAEFTISDHVFTSPTEMWFTYDILTDSEPFIGFYGVANLVDGTWQFRREMMCQNFGFTGLPCDPSAGPIGPDTSLFDEILEE